MSLPSQIAKQLRDVHFGGNWTWSYMKEHLADVTWEQAVTKVYHFNTIAVLVYHMNWYLNAVSKRVQGLPLDGKHEDSFVHPPIQSLEDWNRLLEKTWADAEAFAQLIEQLPESKLWEEISPEYGNFYRNIHGVIEHCHYHLGQIVLLKRIIAQGETITR